MFRSLTAGESVLLSWCLNDFPADRAARGPRHIDLELLNKAT